MADDELVMVAAFLYPHEAKLAQSLLESEGIQTFLRDEHIMNVQPLWGLATGGCRLMVPASSLARAQELLSVQVSDEELAAEAGVFEAPDDAAERD